MPVAVSNVGKTANEPEIRFAGFTDPWEQRKLGELYEKNDERNAVGFGADRTLSIATMTLNDEGNGAAEESLPNYKVIRIGDVAFEGHTNKDFAYGRFVVNDLIDGIMSPRFTCLRPKHNYPVSFWKHYIHSEQVMRETLVKATKSGTMMNELVPEDLFKQSIPVPPADEQELIGSFFSRLDALIALASRKYDKLCIVKKSMLEKMFPKDGATEPEIRFAGFTDPWEQRKLGELYEKAGSGGTPSATNPAYYGGDISFLGISDINGRFITETEKHLTGAGLTNSAAWIVPSGAIALAMYASVGKVGITCKDMATSQAFFNMVFESDITRDFIYTRLEKADVEGEWDALVSTGTQSNLNAEKVREWPVALPVFKEQAAIGQFFSRLDALITLHQRELELLKNVKKSLLGKMFV